MAVLAPFTILFPQDEFANEENLKEVHYCAPTVFNFFFTTGVIVSVQVNSIPNPDEAMARIAKTSGGFVGTVRGHKSAMVEGGGLEFVESGVLVVVKSDGSFSLDSLKRVAESMRPLN